RGDDECFRQPVPQMQMAHGRGTGDVPNVPVEPPAVTVFTHDTSLRPGPGTRCLEQRVLPRSGETVSVRAARPARTSMVGHAPVTARRGRRERHTLARSPGHSGLTNCSVVLR